MRNESSQIPHVNDALALLLIVVSWLGIFLVGISAPPHLLDNDQQRPAAYVMDMIHNRSWIVQQDDEQSIASKPPLFNYAVAISALVVGELNEFSLYFPGALAVLVTGLVIYAVTKRFLDPWSALLAALFWILSGTTFKHVILARSDALFSLLTFSAVCLAVYAGMRKTSWLLFWVLISLATLTKGPLALILALGGLPMFLWELYHPTKSRKLPFSLGSVSVHVIGLLLFFGLNGGWFLAATIVEGPRVYDKLIGKELVGHAVEGDSGHSFGSNLLDPLGYFVSRSLPWCIPALIGIVRIFLRGPEKPLSAWFGRYMAVYFLVALTIFSFAAHKRPDHLIPIIPAAMILAGWEVSHWYRPRALTRLLLVKFFAILLAVLITGIVIFHGFQRDREVIREGYAAKALAKDIAAISPQFPLIYMDAVFAPQFTLNTFRRRIPEKWVASVLEDEPAAFVVLRDLDKLEDRSLEDMKIVKQYRPGKDEEPYLTIISNKEELRYYSEMVYFGNEVRIDIKNLIVLSRGDEYIHVTKMDENAPATVSLRSYSGEPRIMNIKFDDGEWTTVRLVPGSEQSLNY